MKRKNIFSGLVLTCCFLFSIAVFSACDLGAQGPQGIQGEQGIKGEQGDKGEQGVGIESIEKTATKDNVDTYTITMTDGTTATFTITNGVDGTDGTDGEKGEDGKDGQNGTNGVDGTDGVSVTGAEINTNGELILSFSAGHPINLGKVVGEKGANGEKGEDGVGISAIELSKEGDLTVILTNETTVALGNIKGKDGANGMSGADGVSITGAQLNTNGELIISFSKGEPVNLGKIVGADGKNGENGTNGVSVEHISLENYQLTMKLSDGTVFELGNIRGEKGDKGETGVTGANGKSAYQLYQEKYGYAGTEEEWLDDLVNGRLATVITYTVTFNPNNGEETFTETAQKDTKLSRPENPTAPVGYTFAGWYDGDYLDEQWSFIGYTVTEEMTLVAKYEPIVYAVEYHLNKGLNDVSNPAEFTVETLPISLNEPFKQDCEFLGWYADAEFTVPIEELTELGSLSLYAKWKEGTAGLRYSMQSGSYCVSGYSGTETEVYIPTTHYGIPVTAIAASAFQNCADLVSVEVPNSVESIGSSAFKGCSSLTNMVLPFVGGSKTTDQREKQFFGYIFGCIKVSNSNASEVTSGTIRQYFTSSVSNSGLTTYTYYDYYIPTSIHSIVITGGDILEGVFNGCSMLQNVIIPDYVTSIGASVFKGCTGLTEVNFPNSVTSIGDYAFSGCTGLTEVVIPNTVTSIGNYAFNGCTGLTEVIIPDSVASISDWTFYNCTGLTEVIIPDSVTSIGNYAFSSCTGLTEVIIPDSVASISDWTFYNCTGLTEVIIPDSVTSIGNYAFRGCTGLTEVIIPDSVASISDFTFYNCTGLTEVIIPDSVTSIGASAFSSCTGLMKVIIPDSVTSIGASAFSSCTGLMKVIIPDSVTSIGASAFSSCTNLVIYCETKTQPSAWNANWNSSNRPVVWDCNNNDVASDGCVYMVVEDIYYTIKDGNVTLTKWSKDVTTVNIPASITYKETPYPVTSIGASAFKGCTGLTEVVIPNTITSIGSSAFSGCTSLTEVVIPNTITSIGASAFSGCAGLTKVIIPDGVTSIGYSAFRGCAGLIEVVIPDSVTSIADSAFSGCTSLTSVVIGKSVNQIGQSAFYNCNSLSSIAFEDTSTWYFSSSSSILGGTKISVTTPSNNATYFKSSYTNYYWYKQ